jgi:hypothetical protein
MMNFLMNAITGTMSEEQKKAIFKLIEHSKDQLLKNKDEEDVLTGLKVKDLLLPEETIENLEKLNITKELELYKMRKLINNKALDNIIEESYIIGITNRLDILTNYSYIQSIISSSN